MVGAAAVFTYWNVRRLLGDAAVCAAWLQEAAAAIEREELILSARLQELARRLELLQRRLRPARRILTSAIATEGLRWSLRRLRGKPFRRDGAEPPG